MKKSSCLLFSFLLSLAINADSAGRLKAVFIDTPPKMDGYVLQGEWANAAVVDAFQQREPDTGAPISEKTVVYICYDKDHIYFGFQCFDNPKKITAKEMARDAVLKDEDKIVIILDTFLDKRNAFWFEVNPRGSKGDALLSQNGAIMSKDWDGIWQAKSSIHENGWHTEVAIPYKTINFDPSGSAWGLKLIRAIQHKNEIAYWPGANLNSYKYQVSDAGRLVGLLGMSKGAGIDVRPYALAGIHQKKSENIKYPTDAGFDVFYSVTPSIKSVFTYNTDFAQTEADDRQINLTRFRLFFPEKRDFFLDGNNYFQFGKEGGPRSPRATQLIPFFSRRIGLDKDGAPIPITGGVKVTGQHGAWNLGFLDVIDERKTGRKNFAVLRVSRNFGAQSAIGILGTSGNAIADKENSVLGLDLKLATSTFQKDKNLAFVLYGLKSNTRGLAGDDFSFGTEIDYPNDFLSFKMGFTQIENNFTAGLGFVPRKNIRNTYIETGLGPRPRKWGILQLQFETELDYITDLTNRLLTREIELTPLGIRFRSQDEVTFSVSRQYEYLDRIFKLFRTHAIPAGIYEFQRYDFRFSSAKRRPFWATLSFEGGDFYSGSRQQTRIECGYKVGVPLFVGLAAEHNDISLPDNNFSTDIFRLNLDVLFNPQATLLTFIQYDNETNTVGWQSRFRWILKPGNEILLVWNSNWLHPLQRDFSHLRHYELAESTAKIKLNYNFRF